MPDFMDSGSCMLTLCFPAPRKVSFRMNLYFENVPVSVLICHYLTRTWYGLGLFGLILIPLQGEIFFYSRWCFIVGNNPISIILIHIHPKLIKIIVFRE